MDYIFRDEKVNVKRIEVCAGIRLYNDRKLAKSLGYNRREAIEEYFNDTNSAETLIR